MQSNQQSAHSDDGRRLLVASAILTALALAIFLPLLAPGGAARFPWGSDTLGHVLKAKYLGERIRSGSLYPALLPSWYMGTQMLRYYPPLPYYLLVAITLPLGDSVAAAGWMVMLCALLGGLSWLLYRRWVGLWATTLGGALFMILPDNLRVGLAEGNLPRALATALLPAAVYALLRALEPGGRRRHLLALTAIFAALVLSHAMMAAIYGVCAFALAALWAASGLSTPARAARALAAAAFGIMLCGWWLLPSLTGGITELNADAMSEALAVIPLLQYLNPRGRIGDPEAIYVGLTLVVLPLALLFVRAGRRAQPVALSLVGLGAILMTAPGVNDLWRSLPFHQLFWPLRFLGAASFMLLLAIIWRLPALALGFRVVIGLLIAAEGVGSLPLIHTRPLAPDVAGIAQRLATTDGWRVATLDESRLGSSASYAFSADAGREQIFGWAYQGAHTASTVAMLNEALVTGAPSYLADRLDLYGVDAVVLLNRQPRRQQIAAALAQRGFRADTPGPEATLYTRGGGPRATLADWPALGIGRGTQGLSLLFPGLMHGDSPYLDDYTLDELERYQCVVLAGFRWHDRAAAEELARAAAAAGVRVVVDLTGVAPDPLAHIPRFLGVWGEPVELGAEPPLVEGAGASYRLLPLGSAGERWYASVPQGLDEATLSFDYLGERAAAVGYRQIGPAQVWFVGMNLPYHASLTRDPAAAQLLSELLGLTPDAAPPRRAIPLADYRADDQGYIFTYTLDAPQRLLVPVAAFDGARVRVDDTNVPNTSYDRLLAFDAPAGTHTVTMTVGRTPIEAAGWLLSAATLALIIMLDRWGMAHAAAPIRHPYPAAGGSTP
ncbi:hypothetical protein K2Z83_15370 [Oscillochloris sp. ZM17-4]|uniref:6-pyruvoyl-tetrahydropterin synthase-related protein n=1 Tax=Oscillochloris sp. ZM17-4 TaxID=2866714 RepID=UPI001C72E87D|nr:6-pyruvoyl-tetrahydropterin synthase-related protein [Oscillochloris sp. ZM17-4]MBX0329058.1 hypothetical protein [Oscillochloris sp. ZM17-4]